MYIPWACEGLELKYGRSRGGEEMAGELEWIHAAERLPQDGQKVVAMDVAKGVKVCTFLRTKGGRLLWMTDGKSPENLETVIGWIPWRG